MKFDTIRNLLKEVASPKGQAETLYALDMTYRNAREIIKCYPEVAVFLINVIDVVETFPLQRLREARANMSSSCQYKCWENNISSNLNLAIQKMALSQREKETLFYNITSARGGLSLPEEEVESLDLDSAFLVASTKVGDTYYIFNTKVLILDKDGTGVVYAGHTTERDRQAASSIY